MRSLKEYIDNESLEHISNDVRKWFNIKNIFEHLHITINEQLLLEGSGLYKGCYDLAKYIDNKIFENKDNNINLDIFDLSYKNIFTKELRLIIERNSNEETASYKIADRKDKDYNEKRWNEKEQLFNWVDIFINISNNTSSIVELIIHELDHAYDDFQQYLHYDHTYEYKYIESDYEFFDKHKGDDKFTKIVRAINYVFIKFETHAYITQIRGEINKKFNTVSEGYDFIEKNSSTWRQLKIVKNNAEYILRDKEYSNKYCDIFRKITNTNDDNEKILSTLETKLNKYWKKVINHVYLLLVENSISESAVTLSPASKHFIEKLF